MDIHLDILAFLWISMHWLAMDSRSREEIMLCVRQTRGTEGKWKSKPWKASRSRWTFVNVSWCEFRSIRREPVQPNVWLLVLDEPLIVSWTTATTNQQSQLWTFSCLRKSMPLLLYAQLDGTENTSEDHSKHVEGDYSNLTFFERRRHQCYESQWAAGLENRRKVKPKAES